MTKDKALRLALEALEDLGMKHYESTGEVLYKETFTAIKEALAQPEQEPVAFINVEKQKLEWAKLTSWHTPTIVNLPKIPLYTCPPQRQWVGLTEEERYELAVQTGAMSADWLTFMAAVEARLKEKNT